MYKHFDIFTFFTLDSFVIDGTELDSKTHSIQFS